MNVSVQKELKTQLLDCFTKIHLIKLHSGIRKVECIAISVETLVAIDLLVCCMVSELLKEQIVVWTSTNRP